MGRRPEVEYRDDYHPDELVKLMSQGMTDVEIFASFDITKQTFYRWLRAHEELQEAHELGLPKCEAWWIREMRNCWLNKDDKGFKYCISIMNNKFGWKDKADSVSVTVNNNQLTIENKSSQELVDLITKKISRQNIIDVLPIESRIDGSESESTE